MYANIFMNMHICSSPVSNRNGGGRHEFCTPALLHSDGREGFRELPWAPDAVFKADTSDLSQQY